MAPKPNTELALDIIELSRGISGILNDVAAFCKDCAANAKTCNDLASVNTYNRSAERISKLALKIEREDE